MSGFKLFVVVAYCGVQVFGSSPRLDGGVSTGRPPYQTSLYSDTSYLCEASIISYTSVLTAYHCINDFIDGLYLYDISDLTGTSYGHPLYNPNSMDYDVAFIEFEDSILKFPEIVPAPIYLRFTEVPPHTTAVITGCDRQLSPSCLDDVLHRRVVSLVSDAICKIVYGSLKITERMFCFGDFAIRGRSPCLSVSGGPLVWNGTQIGIASWGFGCGNYLGVYTKISNPEISAHIQKYL